MITIYGGNGFIGNVFCNNVKLQKTFKMGRNDINPPQETKKIIYFVSTVDNYNVLTNPYIDIETNLTHLIRVLESCKGKDIEFVFISSWFVYGETDLPAREDSHCKPKGFYSITKLAAEQLLESYCKTFNIKYKIIRLGNVIGKSDSKASKKKNALQYLINEMKNDRTINLYNGGDFYRDFIHVEDVVFGINLIMDKGNQNEIYNLSSTEEPILFSEVIKYIYEKIGSKSKIESMEPTDFHKIVQVKSMILDTSKIENLGFKEKYSIFNALDAII